MKELYAYYYLITVVYTTVFMAFGVVLLLGHVPRQAELKNYISGRRYFSGAFLFLGIWGIIEQATWSPVFGRADSYTYNEVYVMAAVSAIHAWFNGYAYLLMLNPSSENRRKVLLFGRFGLPAILLALLSITLLPPSVSRYFIWVLDMIYIAEISWIFSLCRKTYHINVMAIENYYDEPARIGWMNNVINLTLILAFFNVVQYHFPFVGIPLRIANTLFYIYFFMRIIDYIPAFLSIEKVTPLSYDETPAEKPNDKAPKTPRYYPNNLPNIIATWVASQRFCEENLNINDVAKQMNTNRSYLSAYLNQHLDITYSQWLNTLRVEHAKELFMAYPYKNIAEIGVLVGISEPYNFSRWFKQVTGMSPQQWMEEQYQINNIEK